MLTIAGLCVPAKLYAFVDQHMADSIISNIKANTPEDSIRQLYDAFDVAPRKTKIEIGWKILNIARRIKDFDTMSDQIRHLSVMNMKDSLAIKNLMSISDELPDGDEEKAIKLFVAVEGVTADATFLTPKERSKKLLEYVQEDITPKDNIFDNVYDLYCAVLFLGKESQGNMYHEYIARLGEMIEELPKENYYMRNHYYTTAAIYYTNNNFHDKAIEYDRKLLKQIAELEKYYESKGRKYKNYDRNYYVCYRRMLRNYEALSIAEIKDLYARCARIAERDSDVKADMEGNGRVTAYRLLASKDYAGAIPYLKQALTVDKDASVRRELLGLLVASADSVGDNATLLTALKEYNDMLVEEQRLRSMETLRELQIRYEVNRLQEEKNELEIEKREIKLATDDKIISVVLVSLFVMAIVLMLLCRGYFRLKGDKRELSEENDKLKRSIEDILNDGSPAGTSDLHNFK